MSRSGLGALVVAAALLLSGVISPGMGFAQPQSGATIIEQKVLAAQTGDLSLDELADFFILHAFEQPASADKLATLGQPLPGFAELMSARLNQRMKDAVAARSLEQARVVRALGRHFVAAGSPQYTDIEKFFTVLQQSETVVASQDAEEVKKFIENSGLTEPEVLKQRLLDKTFADTVKASAENTDQLIAIEKIADLYTVRPNELSIDAARPVLEQLGARVEEGTFLPGSWPLGQPQVQSFLSKVIEADGRAKGSVLSLYEWKARQELAANDPAEAKLYYDLVLSARPDPDPENTQFRRELVFSASGVSSRGFALERVTELSAAGGLSVGDKFMLLAKGYYGNTVPILLAVFAAATLVITGLLIKRSKRHSTTARWNQTRLGESAAVGGGQSFESTDEYSRLLAIFGLEDGATEGEIKRAFREAVKQHHPDAQGASGVSLDDEGNVDDTFQELRQAYDRILEIRGSYFGKKR